jgi:hypothetical protein
MFTITDERCEKDKSRFKNLEIGDWYEDLDGNICIKIDDSGMRDNVLYFNSDNTPIIATEHAEDPVKLLDVNLSVSYH